VGSTGSAYSFSNKKNVLSLSVITPSTLVRADSQNTYPMARRANSASNEGGIQWPNVLRSCVRRLLSALVMSGVSLLSGGELVIW
jgi:hypothetical protein